MFCSNHIFVHNGENSFSLTHSNKYAECNGYIRLSRSTPIIIKLPSMPNLRTIYTNYEKNDSEKCLLCSLSSLDLSFLQFSCLIKVIRDH